MNTANTSSPDIAFVVAAASNGEIGNHGTMPWHLPADLKHFKQVTMGHAILMGRRTFESIGRPLAGRDNVVISRNADFKPEGCQVFPSIEQALKALSEHRTLMVIGGATIYAALLPQVSRIYLTRIHETFPADTWFPALGEEWHETAREDHEPDGENRYRYSFITLERAKKN